MTKTRRKTARKQISIGYAIIEAGDNPHNSIMSHQGLYYSLEAARNDAKRVVTGRYRVVRVTYETVYLDAKKGK